MSLTKENLSAMFIGYFIITLSMTVMDFFLPLYLKESGLGILNIGLLLSVGLAIGELFIGVIFGRIQEIIHIRAGLESASIATSIAYVLLYFIPTQIGIVLTNVVYGIRNTLYGVSTDVAMQHNTPKEGLWVCKWLPCNLGHDGPNNRRIISVVLRNIKSVLLQSNNIYNVRNNIHICI